MTAETDFEVAICGAGPVGLALATMLVKRGMAPAGIALIDAKTLEQSRSDPRSIAISYGSRQILEDLGAWPFAATEIHQIHVSRRGQFGRTLIDRKEHGIPALGYVARYGAIVAALTAACEKTGVVVMRPAQASATTERDAAVELQMADGRSITTRILVQAEGGLFAEQSKKSLHRDYRQSAILAHVKASAPISHRAYERFTDEGPLALLPQDDGYSLVWCASPATSERLLGLDDAAFLSELQQTFGTRLGRFTQSTPRRAYSLGLNVQPATSARTVAIGNAAQTLHPVAGQDLNLGLRDASVLARLLAKEVSPSMVAEFEKLRWTDRDLIVNMTDTMARIFSGVPGVSQTLLGISLAVIDTVGLAKHALAELMMFGRR